MDEKKWLLERFEADRPRLRAVAYRMVGSLSEAEDAVQEAWLRLNRSDVSEVGNLNAWLTTVVARVCLDALRARKSRREHEPHTEPSEPSASDPERELALADSIGLALLVVLERLTPAERLAFVLHDMFDLPFEEIGPIVGRSTDAAKQLASRARRRVQGAPPLSAAERSSQRGLVGAYLQAVRTGDFDALLAVLDPEVVRHADYPNAVEARGAAEVSKQALATPGRARNARLALIDGNVGIVVAPSGKLLLVLQFKVLNGKISEIDVISAPERLAQLDLAVLEDEHA